MQFFIIFLPTFASRADIGSSNKYISGSLYIVLAKEIRTFWPPDKLIPFSPISVRSFPSKVSKSSLNWHKFRTLLYLTSSKGKENNMLFLIVSFCIQGI